MAHLSKDLEEIRELCKQEMHLLAPVFLAIERGQCEVVYKEDDKFIVYDKTTETHSLYTNQSGTSKDMFNQIKDRPTHLQVFGSTAYEGLEDLVEEYPFSQRCVQGVITRPLKFKGEEKLEVIPATIDDLPYIQNMYNDDCEEQVLVDAIDAGHMWVGKDKETGQKMCFAGIHIDDSLGFEHVDPSFRRQGYGTELICKISQLAFEKGGYKVLFIHALTHNYPSIKMLTKAGFKFVPNTFVYWVFDTYF